MSSSTTNYNLTKPAGTDYVDIDDINGNMDVIDATMKQNADGIAALRESVTQNLTANSIVTSTEVAKYVRVGRVVNFYITCTCGNISNNQQELFSGLPAAAMYCRFAGIIVQGAADSSNNGKVFRFAVGTDGRVLNAYDARIQGASAIQLQMSGCYICQ